MLVIGATVRLMRGRRSPMLDVVANASAPVSTEAFSTWRVAELTGCQPMSVPPSSKTVSCRTPPARTTAWLGPTGAIASTGTSVSTFASTSRPGTVSEAAGPRSRQVFRCRLYQRLVPSSYMTKCSCVSGRNAVHIPEYHVGPAQRTEIRRFNSASSGSTLMTRKASNARAMAPTWVCRGSTRVRTTARTAAAPIRKQTAKSNKPDATGKNSGAEAAEAARQKAAKHASVTPLCSTHSSSDQGVPPASLKIAAATVIRAKSSAGSGKPVTPRSMCTCGVDWCGVMPV